MNAYIFVDAENHFIRSVAAAEDIVGSSKAAQAFSMAKTRSHNVTGCPRPLDRRRFSWNPDLQLFWDCELLALSGIRIALADYVSRAVYACSCTGDDDKAHQMRVELRKFDFEPIVIRERKQLKAQRAGALKQHGLMEKAKGCDIALATRMVADAAADLYDHCLLFTSDADFLPAVEAVRRMGKIVWVFGYHAALPKRSEYLYVPDRFIDLGEFIQRVWQSYFEEIKNALGQLGEQGPFSAPDA